MASLFGQGSRKALKIGGALLLGCTALAGAGAAILDHLENGPAVTVMNEHGASGQPIVFLSGDTGLRSWSIGGQLALQLQKAGNEVLAIDSLVVFSTRRTPEQVGAILDNLILRAKAADPGKPVVLIGHSYGADMVSVGANYLSPQARESVGRIILIVPGTHAYLQVFPGEWLGTAEPDLAVGPYIARLSDIPTLCIYGLTEKDSLCPTLKPGAADVVGMPGGHDLNRDANGLVTIVARTLRQPNPQMTKA